MSKTLDLLNAGKLTPHATEADTYWANIPVKLTATQIDNDMIEFMASKVLAFVPMQSPYAKIAKNWTPTVKDEGGNEIANPVSAIDHYIDFVQMWIKYNAITLLDQKIKQEAAAQAAQALAAQKAALGLA